MISWFCAFIVAGLASMGVIPDQGYSKDTLLLVMLISLLGATICRRIPREDGSL